MCVLLRECLLGACLRVYVCVCVCVCMRTCVSACVYPIMCNVLLCPCSSLEEQFVSDENMVPALEASEEDLQVAHTKSYLSSLKVHTPAAYSCFYTAPH